MTDRSAAGPDGRSDPPGADDPTATALAEVLRDVVALEPGMDRVPVVVAFSGGMDSTVLLHAACFGLPPGLRDRIRLVAAHLDHALRPESAADAAWCRGVGRAWGVEVVVERLADPPADEAAAREARLAFLARVARDRGAPAILTAHHADDQAETILFRAIRGTGVHGLAGIPAHRGRWRRPFLDLPRAELRSRADRHRLRWRDDSTNAGTGNARARLRRVLPELERVAPGAARSLVELGRRAGEVDREILALVDALVEEMGMTGVGARVEFPLRVLDLPEPALAHLMRRAAERVGLRLDAATTERITRGAAELDPGRRLDVVAGAELHRTAEGFLLLRPATADTGDPPGGDALRISAGSGEGRLHLPVGGGVRTLAVRWATEPESRPGTVGETAVHLPLESITLPVTVRGWRAGDRIRLHGGSKKVVQLLSEAGIPVPDRTGTPVVVDREDRVLWIPDLRRRALGVDDDERTGPTLWMGIADGDE